MRKLLRADFSRLSRDKVFLVSCALMFLAGAGFPIFHFFENLKDGERWKPDYACFAFGLLVPILLSFVTALFIGSGYSDGAMRNKLIVGHLRRDIYLSGFIVCSSAGVLLSAAYLVPYISLGILLLGGFEASPVELLMYTGLNIAIVITFAALFVLIATLCQNKAYSTAGCILLVFALLFVGVRVISALNEPEYYSGYSFTENGVTIAEDAEPNPNYLSGTKRQAYEFLRDFIPGGQAIQLSSMEADNPAALAIYDGIILIAATGCGLLLFRRRDLK